MAYKMNIVLNTNENVVIRESARTLEDIQKNIDEAFRQKMDFPTMNLSLENGTNRIIPLDSISYIDVKPISI